MDRKWRFGPILPLALLLSLSMAATPSGKFNGSASVKMPITDADSHDHTNGR